MRERLPNRRDAETITVNWREKPIAVAVGFTRNGQALETFARTGRPESDLDASADDVAILLSLLLQHGVKLGEIRHSLGHFHDGTSTSIAGAIVDAAIEIERGHRQ